MKKICSTCENIYCELCRVCTWTKDTKYPIHYKGQKFRSMKGKDDDWKMPSPRQVREMKTQIDHIIGMVSEVKVKPGQVWLVYKTVKNIELLSVSLSIQEHGICKFGGWSSIGHGQKEGLWDRLCNLQVGG